MDNEWKNAKSKLENLFTDSKMRSAIKGQLLGIDIKNRLEYFEGDDEEIKASLNTFLFDEHPTRTKIIMNEFPNGLRFIKLKLLLYCTSSEWTYQPARTLYEKLRDKLKEHYKNFFQANIDKTYIPIYLFLSGAGTGKSRNAEEFYRTAIACLSAVLSWDILGHIVGTANAWDIGNGHHCLSVDEDLELRKKIEDAFVFSVGFKNENSLRCGVE
ncbi:6574_t:CDS:2 [Funneliformis geosporum]|nr:6574_t:CDS:2 [Funneliformis geosporum]